MGEEFNKEILFDNIYYLLNEQGKKIGEFETETGVSPGYVSRASKEGNMKPGIDFIMSAADVLNISIDTLLKVSLSGLTPTERYMVSFLNKLENDTVSDRLAWQVETKDFLNYGLEADESGNTGHPLFHERQFYEKSEIDYPSFVTRVVFTSNAYGPTTYIDGDCYKLRMKNNSVLYVMKISKSAYDKREKDVKATEIWLCKGMEDCQFLCSTKSAGPLAAQILNLYEIINEEFKHPKLKKDVRDVIDAFMADDLGNQ